MEQAESRLTLPAGQPFDLGLTLSCGQAFRWGQDGCRWNGVIQGRRVSIRQEGQNLFFRGTSRQELSRYLGFSVDLNEVHSSIDRDPWIHQAIEEFGGIRILMQDPWECLISFICATNANIPVITRRIELICRRFGTPLDGGRYTFPDCDALSHACEEEFRSCSAGYRSGYLCKTAAMVATDRSWADEVREAEYPEAHRLLQQFPGIGEKAADCVLLFGFGKWDAFPIDVWIRRAMERYPGAPTSPGSLTPAAYHRTGEFAREYFGRYAGYAQQYLFMAIRQERGARGTAQVPQSQLVR
jgi:N-glycosylase/DNA lyase